ncbi:MAG: hypothetical protein RLZZ543_1714 [Bacteroidota bacterium]|jgi:hypothetical protein
MIIRLLLAAHFLLLSFNINAQSAALTLSLQDSSLFVAELNGVSYNDPSNTINVSRLQPGTQQLKVIKLMQMGSSVVRKPVFEGKIELPAGKTTVALIDQYNQFRISGTPAIERSQASSQNNQPQTPYFVPNPNAIKAYTQPQTNAKGMSNEQFVGKIEVLKSIHQERQRYQTARDFISLGTYNSNQIAEMMLTLSNENDRVKLADNSYQYAVDKENYGVVFNALNRPSSVRRLTRRLN